MAIELRYYTDPACDWSWASEPKLRRLLWEFGETLAPRLVMGGLARSFEPADHATQLGKWLEATAHGGMPCDPRIWLENPISSTYPACQAVRAASEQGPEAGLRYLRRVREGLFCERKKLDHADALIAEAGPAGVDRARFEVDLRSHATLEGFGADLEQVRAPSAAARQQGKVKELGGGKERYVFPSAVFASADGAEHGVFGWRPYEDYREAAIRAGAKPVALERPEALDVIERLGRAATREVEELTGQPRPLVEAELWSLASTWRLKPIAVLIGTLWELA